VAFATISLFSIFFIDDTLDLWQIGGMKLTKNIITREQALAECPDYVAFVEGNWDSFRAVSKNFETAKRGANAISSIGDRNARIYVRGKISSVDHDDIRAVDGPVVRFTNGEFSWRVDGNGYAHIETLGVKVAKAAVNAVLAKL
jgi:hypothetical protein